MCPPVGPRRWLGGLAGPGGGNDGGGPTGLGGVLVGAHGCRASSHAERRGPGGEYEAPPAGYSSDRQSGAAGGYIDEYPDAQDTIKDQDAGLFFYHLGCAAVGLDGRGTVAPAAAQTAAGNTPTSPAAAAHIPDRPPKTFAAWTQQVTAYEEKLFDGKRRTFPVQELLGAEEVLARMWFEHTVTKMYTPVNLGEILCRRTWTPGRMLNPLAADRAAKSAGSKALRLEHGALVPEEPSEWSPRSLLSTIDGANAARWAWILVGVGEEADVVKYADWFIAKARAHADMVPAIQAYWHKSAWTIAMALRNSTSFGEAVKSVMNDVATWQEIIIANAAPPRRPPQLPPADPNASTEEYDDQGAGTWGGGNRRKRRRPGKPKGKGRDGKDQDPPKKTDAANQQDQGWWSTRGGGKQQNQQAWWGHAGGDQRHQNTDGGDRPWKRTGAGKGGGRR